MEYVVIIEMQNPDTEEYYYLPLTFDSINSPDMAKFTSLGAIREIKEGHPLRRARWFALNVTSIAAIEIL